MHSLSVKRSELTGTIAIPPSKSHTLRAILFALMAEGKSTIENYLDSPDTDAMIKAVEAFGASVEKQNQTLFIQGTAGKLRALDDVIDAGNSGLVLRLVGAIAALIPSFTIITGDDSIRHNRPALPLIEGLRMLGASVESMRGDGLAPLIIKGPLKNGIATINGEDSQPVSALLIACSFLQASSEIYVTHAGEKPWIDLTLHWLDRLGIRYEREGYTHYTLLGNATYSGFTYTVPGDFSSAAFAIAAAVITGSELTVQKIDKDDIQGDKKLIGVLQEMGANISWQTNETLIIGKSSLLQGQAIDINDYVDALPILAVIGCFAKGQTKITGASIARKKESDRIHAIASELKKMGADIIELEDGLLINESKLTGCSVESHKDHRIALSLAIGALAAEGSTCIQEPECIKKTYKNFVKDFQTIGCKINAYESHPIWL